MASIVLAASSSASTFFMNALDIEGCLRDVANACTISGPRVGSASAAMTANSAETP
jgi:hypothetical protein